MKVNPIDTAFEMDSPKVRIPLTACKIIDEGITGNLIIVNDKTGLVLDKIYKRNAHMINDRGINIYFAIETQVTAQQTTQEYLTMLITSKLLKEKYLEGITKKNIKLVYKALMDYKIVWFSYKSFLAGEVTDVDFKKDIETTEFNKIIQGCYSLTKNTDICKKYEKKDNKGIQWSERKTTEFKSKPFVKIYHKGLDLKYKKDSREFYNNFIKGTESDKNIDNRARIEFTIKNKQHFRKFGIKSTTLKNILALTREKKNEMFKNSIEKHLDIYDIKPIIIREGLRANDKIILKLMDIAIKTKQFTTEKLLQLLLIDIDNKSQRSKKRKELLTLFNERLKLSNKENLKEAKLRDDIKTLLFS